MKLTLSPNPQKLETLGRMLALTVASFTSPSFPLMRWVLDSYVSLDGLMSGHMSPERLKALFFQLEALGPQVLLLQMAPLIMLCGLAGIFYLVLCSRLGAFLARRLAQHMAQPAMSPYAISLKRCLL